MRARTRTSLPLGKLIDVSTVTDLANLLRTGQGSRSNDLDKPQVRAVEVGDRDEVCRLLDEGFGRMLPRERIFDHPWQPETMPRGFVLMAAGEIVGFIG